MTSQDRVLNHYEHPYHKHIPTKSADFNFFFQGCHQNDTCGDHINVWGRYDTTPEKRIVGLWWEGSGCCLSQAMGSMLAEHCEAKRLHEVMAFTQDDMFDLFGLDVKTGRIECVLVAYRALMKALENHDGE
jgi:NifU-like protein involved in Fe-S cluster formation